ncbi:MAG: O-antigen ligase family protein [Bacteroidales bacterium]|nr:O-antigen ligase family protein [Bacteroidales bacterium]
MVNLLAFIILTAYMVIYMNRYCVLMKYPANSRRKLMLEGPEAFLVLLFATGTMAMSSSGGGHGASGGFNLQAIRLLLLEVLLFWSVFKARLSPQWGIGTVFYLIFILWLVYSMTYSNAGQYGWRYILKFLYPLVIMLGASAIARDEEVFVTICVWARRVALITVVLPFIPVVNGLFGGFFWYNAALNIHYATIVCISLVLFFYYGRDWKDLAMVVLFIVPCFLQVHRTGLLSIFGALGVWCFYKFKWVSLPYIIGVAAIGVGIIFYVPSFHEKMFWREGEKGQEITIQDLREGNISQEDVRNNGREAVWQMLEEQFYEGHELRGSGIGSCQKFLYEAGPTVVKQSHGDYVQIRCDVGMIGMVLYLAILAVILIHCFIESVRSSNPPYLKACAMIAAGALAGNYMGMYSDNVVTYTMCTSGYPFGFYGIMLGLKAKLKGQ